jgi:hypothetical protein
MAEAIVFLATHPSALFKAQNWLSTEDGAPSEMSQRFRPCDRTRNALLVTSASGASSYVTGVELFVDGVAQISRFETEEECCALHDRGTVKGFFRES